MTRIILALLAIAAAIAAGASRAAPGSHGSASSPRAALAIPAAGARCHIGGSGNFVRPDDKCTPGSFDALSRGQACVHKTRPRLSYAAKLAIVRAYGFTRWSGRDGEIDHLVPFFLGGRTDASNLWPETGGLPNTKDDLEFKVYDLVCKTGTMTVNTARGIFLSDWTTAYAQYVRP
jgi:hypothetical protein